MAREARGVAAVVGRVVQRFHRREAGAEQQHGAQAGGSECRQQAVLQGERTGRGPGGAERNWGDGHVDPPGAVTVDGTPLSEGMDRDEETRSRITRTPGGGTTLAVLHRTALRDINVLTASGWFPGSRVASCDSLVPRLPML